MEASALVRTGDPDVIAHAWTSGHARINPPSMIPQRVVKEKARSISLVPAGALGKRRKAWKAASVYGDEFHPGGLSVVGDLSPADMKAVVVYALEFEDMLIRGVGGSPKSIPYRIKIFADEREFRTVASKVGAANALSYYHPGTKDIVAYFDTKQLTARFPGSPVMTHENLQSILSHEFTHAYMDIVYSRTSPLWFAEGIAEYYQHFEWRGGQAAGGALNLKELQILSNNEPLPLVEFMSVPRERMYGPEFPQLYAQAWAVTHYLKSYHQDAIADLIETGKTSARGLEAGWRLHFREMMAAASMA